MTDTTTKPGRKTLDIATETPFLRYGDVVVTIEIIDPETATRWLEKKNTHNRNFRDRLAATYAIDMEEGEWPFTGSAICLAGEPYSDEEILLDGQHRLGGIKKSGVPLATIVVRGLDPDVQKIIDTNAPRRLADHLKIALRDMWTSDVGIDVNQLAAISRRVLLWRKGTYVHNSKVMASRTEMLKYIAANEATLRPACRMAMQARDTPGLTPSVIGTAYLLCAEVDEVGADAFFGDQVVKGLNLSETDPAWLLRRKMTRTDTFGVDPNDAFMFALKAWNHWREGEKLKVLQAPRGGWPQASEWRIR